MTRVQRAYAVPSLTAVIVMAAGWAGASTGPRWSVADLASFSDVIVTGRVVTVTSGWDPAVYSIYTHVTIVVDEVIKGPVTEGPITIKQLGGQAGEIGLSVADQPVFTQGELVLLFLEARPRDRTLYTAGLSQGKWNVLMLPNGDRVATRGTETIALGSARAAGTPFEFDAFGVVDTSPVEAASSHPFSLMTIPFLYSFFPPVDVQAGGQPGLPGGGFAEIQAAIDRWNGAGSSFRFMSGSSSGQPRCASQFLGVYRVTISFLDPCGEISNSGGTLAIGGSYYTTAVGTTVSGRFFRYALEGFLINNDSSVAFQFLRQSGCFHDVQLHELGHVLGLGHSTDNTAIMFPSISNGCTSEQRGLGADDIQGIHFIYPAASLGAPGQPIVSRVATGAELLTVEWFLGPGAAPTSHRLDFFLDGTTQVVSVTVGPATRASIPIPLGASGSFAVRVTPFTGATPGPESNTYPFVIGAGCVGPPPSPDVSGSILSGTATVSWPAVVGATHYVLQVGTTPGGSDLLPPTNIGTTTTVSASGLPHGFAAWVRLAAVNACGQSTPSDFLLR